MKAERIALLLLALAVVGTAVMVAHQRHESRRLFYALDRLNAERDEANIEWWQLKLEQATMADNNRIEQIAREELGLRYPTPAQVVVIRP